MSEETCTYATYKEFCGNREQPWVTRISEAVDWTQQETTRDQARIEAVLDTMAVTGAPILHVGVGNSKFAQRFASDGHRARWWHHGSVVRAWRNVAPHQGQDQR